MSRVDDLQQALLKDPAYTHEFAGLAARFGMRGTPSDRPAGSKRLKAAQGAARRMSESRPT